MFCVILDNCVNLVNLVICVNNLFHFLLIFCYKGDMEMIGTRLDPEVVKVLQEIAEEEHRPISNLLRLIILDWLDYRKGIKIELTIYNATVNHTGVF